MVRPIQVSYNGVALLLHEAGCQCDQHHASSDFGPNGRTVILTTHDDDAEQSFHQVWYRTGQWGLREAIEALLKRSHVHNRLE